MTLAPAVPARVQLCGALVVEKDGQYTTRRPAGLAFDSSGAGQLATRGDGSNEAVLATLEISGV